MKAHALHGFSKTPSNKGQFRARDVWPLFILFMQAVKAGQGGKSFQGRLYVSLSSLGITQFVTSDRLRSFNFI